MLPKNFMERMERMLGEDFPAFLDCCGRPPFRGIRLNPLKCTREILEKGLDFPVRPAPFSKFSYYLPAGAEKPGTLALHHAGAFYCQEPSASAVVTVMDPRPGEKILDLCAAPGGKSTQIAAALGGQGLLWSNEVVSSRVPALLSNIERLGVRNAVVSSCRPDVLCGRLAGFFDRVLVDAPCSGEGMFRRDERAVHDWSAEHVKACAARQRAILRSAAGAVRENGVLVYSTCTFSPEENEGVVESFLRDNPDFAPETIDVPFGRSGYGLPQARRIFPMDGGEGHFVARMRRLSQNPCAAAPCPVRETPATKMGRMLYREIFRAGPQRPVAQAGESLLLLPDGVPCLEGLHVVRAGVLLGEVKTGRVEPAHALFMAAKPQELISVLPLSSRSPQLSAFLHGEELAVGAGMKGFTGVACDGIMTGFGKCSGGRMKNRYPKGLRNF